MARLVSARTAAPYLFVLVLSSLMDLLLRSRLLFDLYFHKGFAHSFSAHSFSARYLPFSAGVYFLVLTSFFIILLVKVLPKILLGGNLRRRDVRLLGLLATLQLASNLVAINLAIYLVDINSYELLGESFVLYFSINLVFLFWYWFFDYPLRDQRLSLVGIDGKGDIGIPLGILFPEEALEKEVGGACVWAPALVDYVFFTLISSNTFGCPEGHGVIGSRLKWTQVVHTICMILVFIVIVARAINTLS
jgi:hypothetical protein